MDGARALLRWLAYCPAVRGAPLPVLDISGVDVVEREIGFMPTRAPYDPRHLLDGCPKLNGNAAAAAAAAAADGAPSSATTAGESSSFPDEAADVEHPDSSHGGAGGGSAHDGWASGFFDRGSFEETLAGWARSVVVGRARLGGIPMGVIVTESRTVEVTTPADPAAPDSQEQVTMQAGQVWFPDSAYKTAQHIRDVDREGLPLMIFANWRGFSGGQRDMFNEVLKFGAMIVDALVAFTRPVFVRRLARD